MSAVYFARCGDYVKIGFASNPTQRVKKIWTGRGLITPTDLKPGTPARLILAIPFCRMRDERNLHLLFANHWVVGEWYRWSAAFEVQMRTMQFVTHDVRLKDLRRARRALGLSGAACKEAHWGKQTQELLADLRDRRAAA